MKTVELVFDKSQTRLAGFPFGEITYKEQVQNIVNESGYEQIKIIFPKQIEKVASSFVQGFFSELINTIGYDKIEKQFMIEASNQELAQRILQNIY